jgi:NAD(P)H dehydrogenase (quinone)
MKILVVYYSLYGHTKKMADAVVKGIRNTGAEASLKRVAETLSPDIIEMMGAKEIQKELSKVPVVTTEDLDGANAVIFGSPTRFGNMCAQMKQFLDSTGGLWQAGKLIGKPGAVFTSTATQHGGQEATILSIHTVLLHHGMIIVGLPYSFAGQMRVDEVTGGSPYGASTIAASDGSRMSSETELSGAEFLGKRVAEITAKLIR